MEVEEEVVSSILIGRLLCVRVIELAVVALSFVVGFGIYHCLLFLELCLVRSEMNLITFRGLFGLKWHKIV